MKTTHLSIGGMHCVSCKALIEDVCRDIAGVTDISVDVEHSTATVTHADDLDLSRLTQEIEHLGKYTVSIVTE